MAPEGLRDLALTSGLYGLSAVPLAVSDDYSERFISAREHGLFAGMDYLSETSEWRLLLREFLPGQKSALVAALPYPAVLKSGPIAPYALFQDYHIKARAALSAFAVAVAERFPGVALRPFCDIEPLPEKELARAAGLGFQGKNTLLLHPDFGSRFFICGLLTDRAPADFGPPPDRVPADGCGDCRRCVEACPTGALKDGTLDARRCLSYHTVENRGEIPEAIGSRLNGHAFGCGICEAVCPFNRSPNLPPTPGWSLYPELASWDLERLEAEVKKSFRAVLGRTPASRLGKRLFLRNLALAMGKRGEK